MLNHGGPTMAKGDQPWRHRWSEGTICSAANGPGGPAAAVMGGPGGPILGGPVVA